ncbi:MAG TPA: sulfurtransferase [Actinomycetota bacterium]|jgi:thiosulfate/3-mercaptopyruvate sulfurtransferase|nr:sulfurtransferase [Actinomycetota bacterium]
MSEYANPGALVETDWLAEHLDDPAIRIVEVDEDLTAYQKGHIPGAVQWSWFGDLHDPVRRDFIDQARLSELLSRSGVSRDSTVILYGGNNNWFAAYAYWLLKYLGFDRVKILNGGRQKWELESRELSTEEPSPPKTAVRLEAPVRKELRALRDEVLTSLRQAAFVDVRAPDEYRGEKLAPDHLPQEQAQVPGHIPGAVNITWSKAAREDGTFRSAEELREVYRDLDPSRKVISYCRIGERSSHTWFVLSELLGYPNAKNYDGSWTEYGSLVGAPVER